MITLWGSTYAKLVCSIILRQPFTICGCSFPLNFKRHAHSILESNSLLILISCLIICNAITQKPPSFKTFGQKKTVSFLKRLKFLWCQILIILKLSYIKYYREFDKNSSWCRCASSKSGNMLFENIFYDMSEQITSKKLNNK